MWKDPLRRRFRGGSSNPDDIKMLREQIEGAIKATEHHIRYRIGNQSSFHLDGP